MNAIDGIFNVVSTLLEGLSLLIDPIDIPWSKLNRYWAVIQPSITQMNTIFPLDSLLVIAGLMIGFVTVMLMVWFVKFVKSFIPFLG